MKRFLCGSALIALTLSPILAANTPQGPGSGALGRATMLSSLRQGATGTRIARISSDQIMPFETAQDGGRFLLLSVGKAGSEAARVRFANFHLPANASVFVYGTAEDGSLLDVSGPIRGNGPVDSGEFWSLPVRGKVYIELDVTGEAPADLPFEMVEIAGSRHSHATEGYPAAISEVRTSWYRGRNLTYEVRGGVAIFENDIELGPADLLEPARAESKQPANEAYGISGSRYRWPGGVIPYDIDPAIPNPGRVTAAVDHWNSQLGGVITFVPRTNQANYVLYQYSTDASRCSSNVGMVGYGVQAISVGDYCSTGNMIHESGHAVGLWHEQSRSDRDSFVKILFDNIQSGLSYNFAVQTNGILGGAYDFGSIMHYGAYSFSSNGLPTIETIPAGIAIGQRGGLSRGDIDGVRALYSSVSPAPIPPPQPPPAATVAITLSSNPSGVTLFADGSPVTAPYTAQWAAGSSHTVSASQTLTSSGTRQQFVTWSDGGALSHSYLTPSSAAILTATYSTAYQVSVAVQPAGSGVVNTAPASPDGYYPSGSGLALNAVAASDYCFTGWTGLLSGTPAQTSIAVTKQYDLTANFQPGAVTFGQSLQYVSRDGGEVSTGVNANSGCAWKATTAVNWVTLKNTEGTGPGMLTVAVAKNTTGKSRIARIIVGTRVFIVYQLA